MHQRLNGTTTVSLFHREEELRPVFENDIQNPLVFQTTLIVADFLFNTHRYVVAIDLYQYAIGLLSVLASSSGLSSRCKKKEFDAYVSSLTEELEITKRSLQSELTQEKEASSYQQRRPASCQAQEDVSGVSYERRREIAFYKTLGSTFFSQGRYMTSIWYFEKAAEMIKATGNKLEEQRMYTSLAVMYNAASQFDKAIRLQEKALHLSQEIGDLKGEMECCNNLGSLCNARGQFDQAMTYYAKTRENALDGKDRVAEAMALNNLGNVFLAKDDYIRAIKHYEESLSIRDEIGDTKGRSISYNNISCVYYALGLYEMAIEYQNKALAIDEAIGDKKQVAVSYSNLGGLNQALGKHQLSLMNHNKGLKIRRQIGDSAGECRCYKEISSVYDALGQLQESQFYYEKAQKLERAIMDRRKTFENSGQFIAHIEKGLEIIEEFRVKESERLILYRISLSHTSRVNFLKVSDYFVEGIKKHEISRLHLSEKHKFYMDEQSLPLFKGLALVLVCSGHFTDALLVLEKGRARALVDLLLKVYPIQEVARTHFENFSAITSVFTQGKNFLFMAILIDSICLWFIDRLGKLTFKSFVATEDVWHDSFFNYFRTGSLQGTETDPKKTECHTPSSMSRPGAYSLVEEVAEILTYPSEEDGQSFVHQVIFGIVGELPDDDEVIIVPEGPMFRVPFALLKNDNGNYLAEKVRIRVIPSITTHKIIHDSPADHHCNSGALLVGDPYVRRVKYQGRLVRLNSLPCAKKEVEMIAKVLGCKCLVGLKATKGEVLQRISNVSLVHLAAHGSEEDGSIALAADDSVEDGEGFILTPEEIAKVGLKAKLVVLSTCHGARGRILNAEGVVGMVRAFLASGARSVLAALWAIDDRATLAFMKSFYKNLFKMSASGALQQSIREMRDSDEFNKVREWASFVLYGDDVTLDLDEIYT